MYESTVTEPNGKTEKKNKCRILNRRHTYFTLNELLQMNFTTIFENQQNEESEKKKPTLSEI